MDDDNESTEEISVAAQEPEVEEDIAAESDLAKKTRRELEDLDDLDI